MRIQPRRLAAVLAGIGSGAVILQSPNFACESYAVKSLMTTVDMCFIFDCNNGAFGGTAQPCGTGLDAEGLDTPGLFVDCPDDNQP
jgi:hypothetical protein